MKTLLYGIGALGIAGIGLYLAIPKGPRDPMEFADPYRVARDSVRGARHMAATGTPWATRAALEILENGGNAFDAGMAALLALNVTYPEAASFPSIAPTMIYDAEKGEVRSYCGVGTAPKQATIALFRERGYETVPRRSILSQLIPSSPDVIVSILEGYGTRSFADVSREARRLASEGFPLHSMTLRHMDLSLIERLGFRILLPYNAEVYLGDEWWRPLHHKDRFRQPDLARTLGEMTAAEARTLEGGGSRSEGLKAVRDYFYRGPIAEAISRLHREEGGLITKEDLADYTGYWEGPLSGRFGSYTIHANRTWSQGAVLPMLLQLLDGIDLRSMGRESPRTVHTVIQAIELAMADREAYFGDPRFVDVPVEGLLSKEYAALRRKALTPGRAFGAMPAAGDPTASGESRADGAIERSVLRKPSARVGSRGEHGGPWGNTDTSYLAVTDRWGNSISLTPSDFPESPMVPGTGLCLGIRMTQFRLDPEHPAALAPGKRPRVTPNAVMITRDGELVMSFGTPEGDQQTQALTQVFLNLMVFGMDVQDAIDAPRFRSENFPNSFSPHEYNPGKLVLERGLFEKVGAELDSMGYEIEVVDDWSYGMGAVCAITRDPETGELVGGADPRQESWAEGR
jgi:gamma-glutamyltranspeptidase/glutathione hydrolase